MSEQQKVFASLSGSVIGHLLLFVAVFFLLTSSRTRDDVSSKKKQNSGEQEVTIMMSDLMEQIERAEPEQEPLIPEPEPDPLLAENQRKAFINTDLNTPSAEKPENARYESDRSTRAATELMPNANEPQVEGPTLNGDSPLPYLELQNRKFVDGQLDQPSSSGAEQSGAEAQPALPPTTAAMKTGRTEDPAEPLLPEEDEAREGADLEDREGSTEEVIGNTAESMVRPEADTVSPENQMAASQKSFVDPLAGDGASRLSPNLAEEDREAKADQMTEEKGEVASPEQEKKMAVTVPQGVDQEQKEEENTPEQKPGEMSKPGDAGLFANGFSPERHQNKVNGTLSNLGQNAVDAEETAVGKYKKSVTSAISQKWHVYRERHKDFVSFGLLKLTFNVASDGSVKNLKIVKNDANSVLAEFSLKAILEADIPRMPAEVREELGASGLEMKYDIIIY